MDLRYCLYTANLQNEMRHPQVVMKELGITYKDARPQSIADQWWFFGCDNTPKPLPKYLTKIKPLK